MQETSIGSGSIRRTSSKWRWRSLAIGLPILMIVFAANHIEHACRQKRIRSEANAVGALIVRSEGGVGHNQIGIDESSLGRNQVRSALTFSSLGNWDFDPQKPSTCPGEIQSLSGREASCTGFMYPLEAGIKLRLFCLLRTTQTCCYGPRPQFNQYLFVEMREKVKFERLAPVTVSGKFFVDPQPAQGYIYRMEGTSVASASEEEPETDASQVAKKSKLPLFDFTLLDEMERRKLSIDIPTALFALNGKSVVMDGFILSRQDAPDLRLVLGKNWWDGKAQGTPPTFYTAATVLLRNKTDMPAAWKQKEVFIGSLRLTTDPAAWAEKGIVTIDNAVRADAAAGTSRLRIDSGPCLSVIEEILVLIAFVILVFRLTKLKQPPDPPANPTSQEMRR